jgi:hypothetical protein
MEQERRAVERDSDKGRGRWRRREEAKRGGREQDGSSLALLCASKQCEFVINGLYHTVYSTPLQQLTFDPFTPIQRRTPGLPPSPSPFTHNPLNPGRTTLHACDASGCRFSIRDHGLVDLCSWHVTLGRCQMKERSSSCWMVKTGSVTLTVTDRG